MEWHGMACLSSEPSHLSNKDKGHTATFAPRGAFGLLNKQDLRFFRKSLQLLTDELTYL